MQAAQVIERNNRKIRLAAERLLRVILWCRAPEASLLLREGRSVRTVLFVPAKIVGGGLLEMARFIDLKCIFIIAGLISWLARCFRLYN
jgi:hypothetical protein